MTPSTDIGPDQAFEDQVRGMLARRAGDVGAADLDPAVDRDRPPLALAGASRRPWVLAAAAAVVALALAVAVVANGPVGDPGDDVRADDGTTTTTTDPTTAVVIGGLPAGVTPDDLVALSATPARTPEDAAQAYLGSRLAGLVDDFTVAAAASPLIDAGPDWVSYDWWVGTGEAVSSGAAPGNLFLRRDTGGWEVVAALSPVFDVRGVTVSAEAVTGAVRSAYPEQWAVGVTRPGPPTSFADWDAVLAHLGSAPNGTATRSQALGLGPLPQSTVVLGVIGRVIAGEVAFVELAVDPAGL